MHQTLVDKHPISCLFVGHLLFCVGLASYKKQEQQLCCADAAVPSKVAVSTLVITAEGGSATERKLEYWEKLDVN